MIFLTILNWKKMEIMREKVYTNSVGDYHRDDGPAVEYANGDKEWWVNGRVHRIDGPAVEYANGDQEWWLNGLRHREDGPAIDYIGGSKYWYFKGDLRRSEFADGTVQNWMNGEKIS